MTAGDEREIERLKREVELLNRELAKGRDHVTDEDVENDLSREQVAWVMRPQPALPKPPKFHNPFRKSKKNRRRRRK